MTDLGGVMAAAEVVAGDPHRTSNPARDQLETATAHNTCANCATHLAGPYCHECGQRGHLHARVRDLLHEAIEGIAHFDGRTWRTLPLLALNPGRLSRKWRAGRRVRYVQPLHLFLFATFLLFLIPNFTGRHLIDLPDVSQVEQSVTVKVDPGNPQSAVVAAGVQSAAHDHSQLKGAARWGHMMGHKLRHVAEHNDYYGYKIESLAYKLSFLFVPISMLILSLLLVFKRGFSFYDHGVVSLYGVGFLTLMLALASIFPPPIGVWLTRLALFLAPLHAITHLRGAYGLSWAGAVLRGLVLCVLSAFAFLLFLVGVFLLGVFG